MQTKLTLRLDDKLIRKAKAHAEQAGKSLSQIVAEYFSLLGRATDGSDELTPIVTKLKGSLRQSDVDAHDYHEYLEKKYR